MFRRDSRIAGRTPGRAEEQEPSAVGLPTAVSVLIACSSFFATLPAFASYEDGIAAFKAKKYAEAVRLLTEAKKTNFSNATLHYYLASALVRLNSKDQAIKEFKVALDLEPEGQIAAYCQEALKTLTPPAAAVASAHQGAPGSIGQQVATIEEKKVGSQQPQVFCMLCGCPMCHRVELMMTELHSKYGDRVAFIRTVKDTTDSHADDLIRAYGVRECPTILLFDNHGRMVKSYTKMMSQELVFNDVAALAPSSNYTRLSGTTDKTKINTRNDIVNELEARIAADRLRVDNEIKMIKDDVIRTMTEDADRRRSSQPPSEIIVNQIVSQRARPLEDDFERRKKEFYNGAKERLRALGIDYSETDLAHPHQAAD